MIIGFGFQKQTGKDTCCEYLRARHGFEQLSFAEPLKEILGILIGRDLVPDKQLHIVPYGKTVRELLQLIGTELFRDHLSKDVWCHVMRRRLTDLKYQGKYVCISDVRFQNELDLIHELGGATVRVHRPGHNVAKPSWLDRLRGAPYHASEHQLHDANWSHHIYNTSSLGALHTNIDQLLASMHPSQ